MYEKIEKYLAWKATHHRPASVAYRRSLLRFVEMCGDKEIEQYTIQDVVLFTNLLAERFANETVRFALAIIKNFFHFYNEQNYKCLSPWLIEIPRQLPPNSFRAIEKREVQEMVSIISADEFTSLRALVIILMLWDTGVRVSELRDLNVSDIDQEKRRAIISTKKAFQARIILWSEATNNYLRTYLHERGKIIGITSIDSPVFIGRKGKEKWKPRRLTTKSIQRIVKAYGNEANVTRKVTPHRFRHGWAHTRRDAGASLPFIQRGLGHKNAISSMRYQQYSDPEFEMTARKHLKTPVIASPYTTLDFQQITVKK
ncbi:MAG TPA: site-specific integrase [Bacteroidia bacterium]|nr:site-specific integrase [Bacteroidia bacterium]